MRVPNATSNATEAAPAPRETITSCPLGLIPAEGSLDLVGLEISDSDLESATRFDAEEWKNELPLIEQWYENFGDHLPASMRAELDALRERLGA
ncbi:phosphoenolpyruvate carboxykinase domain-containing protein [Staphylococcus aureus]